VEMQAFEELVMGGMSRVATRRAALFGGGLVVMHLEEDVLVDAGAHRSPPWSPVEFPTEMHRNRRCRCDHHLLRGHLLQCHEFGVCWDLLGVALSLSME